MRAFVPEYELIRPRSLDEILTRLTNEPGVWRPIAGGTDLMVLFEAGKLPYKKLISLWGIRELRGIELTPEHVTLGALTTYTQVRKHAVLQQEFPLLGVAASLTGGIATQNRGTLGGNIANASPAADSSPALLVYDAEVELISAGGSRWIPYAKFHTGYKTSVMREDELLARIRLPRATVGCKHYSCKVGTRKAHAISKVCMAAVARLEGGTIQDVRIALGSVAPTVIRCTRTEAALRGRDVSATTIAAAQAAIGDEVAPIDDIRSTARYRRQVTVNLIGEFLEGLRV